MSLALEAAYARAPVQMVDAPPLRRVADLLREATEILAAEAVAAQTQTAEMQQDFDLQGTIAAAVRYRTLVEHMQALHIIAYRMETL